MSNRFAHVSNRLFNAPLMIRPEKAEMLVAALAHRLGITSLTTLGPEHKVLEIADLSSMALAGIEGDQQSRKIYQVIDGVAVIPIEGTLVHKLGTVDPWSGMTGYDGLAVKLRMAMADDDVTAIWLDIDSPGGEVSGCFDFCDELYSYSAAQGGKPIWGFVNESCYSAAFAIGSQCDRLILPRTGGVGSVGVLTMHVDWSEAMRKDGINATLIYSGEHKVDGNSLEPLPKPVRAEIQRELDTMRQIFAETVARGRRMSVDQVLGTEAACFDGQAGISVGFADAVASESLAFTALLART